MPSCRCASWRRTSHQVRAVLDDLEQEPEDLRTWFKQRTRWARGSFYLMRKFFSSVGKAKNKALAFEVFYFVALYYIFLAAIVVSALLFVLSTTGLISIPVPGPYLEVWLAAYCLSPRRSY